VVGDPLTLQINDQCQGIGLMMIASSHQATEQALHLTTPNPHPSLIPTPIPNPNPDDNTRNIRINGL
jgi:hypothetical protein